ncbi:unnamed protein product [Brugia pahangi]|uniref:DUF4283 domain-containing protein n=1 Tax=Brugia pahangi TaxID=6280 RepID=A0A0N4T5Q1_BRUPA|nr:unnamed protein product [Brugia pahangi]
MDEFDEDIELMRDSIITIESSSWNATIQIDRLLLNTLLGFGYINETMLPWNSGRPIQVKIFWGQVGEVSGFEILRET